NSCLKAMTPKWGGMAITAEGCVRRMSTSIASRSSTRTAEPSPERETLTFCDDEKTTDHISVWLLGAESARPGVFPILRGTAIPQSRICRYIRRQPLHCELPQPVA